ncbi:MAG: penicillin-binding protein 2 [Gammaproteobacteria bacterium]
MSRRVTLKDYSSESRLFLHRVVAVLVFIVLALAVTVSRLVYLQVIDHQHYTTLSNDNRVKVLPIAPTRGLIFDRNGVLLADNVPSYRLEIIPEQVKNMKKLLAQLRQTVDISDDDLKQFQETVKRSRPFESIPLRFHLSDTEVARLAVIRHRLPGVNIVARLTRHYTTGSSMAHVVGYVGRISEQDLQHLDATNYRGTSHVGKIGIEKYYEDILHGKVGYQQVETNAQGRIMRTLQKQPPVPGRNVYLSIDLRLQEAAEKALGDYNGSIVAINPKTGEVLALVSKPGYDPNLFVNGISRKDYRALRNNPSQPLYNRALLGQYPPGSTIKPFIGLAGLHYGTTNGTQTIFCPGYYKLPNEERKFRDWKRWGHGRVNLDQAITQSCDVYFYNLAYHLGIDHIHDFLHQFGFGQRTGIDMNAERPGLLPSRQWKRKTRGQPWFPGETLNTGIGQGFMLTTPLQLASATATLSMRGFRVVPRMLHAVQNPSTKRMTLQAVKTEPPITDVKKDTWNYVIKAMTDVVYGPHGTAYRLKHLPFKIAGKTGTAQVFGIKQEEEYDEATVAPKLRDHALFIAFAPADDPKIALAVVVEHGGSGGSVAAPIAGKVLEEYLEHDNPS